MDRRDKSIVDSFPIETSGGKFERIRDDDRIYLWTRGTNQWEMYWMQDLNKDGEDDLLIKINQYLMNPSDAAPDAPQRNTTTSNSTSGPLTSNANNSQIDALSNILENLGIPEAAGNARSVTATPGVLTLADLQGAMASLNAANTTAPMSTPTPLREVVTPSAITALMENEEAKNRLLEFLPEEQRTLEHLEDNLRSPQVQQTLNSLSNALYPDEQGSLDGYHSVIANFQLDPMDGEAALAAGNPIQAFLDCILASVSREEGGETRNEGNEEQMEE
jgi:26S proteasome regulatory subunit N13